MKSAFIKDSQKMFKNNFGRFVSIVLIIMLGTSFFIGMNSVSPAMEQTAEDHMKKNHVYDFNLVSNIGYTDEDINKFKEITSIIESQGIYSYDALASFNEKDLVIRLSSLTDNSEMNKNYLVEGREVQQNDECLISSRLHEMYEYNVGQTIKAYRKDDTNIDDTLNYKEFKIVGIAKNPTYLSKFYGNTSLLTGELNGYILVKKEVFKNKEYSSAYIKTNIDENISRFSNEYQDKSDDIFSEIDKLNKDISEKKYNKIYDDTNNNLNKVTEKTQNAINYIKNKYLELQQSQSQINKEITNIAHSVADYYQVPNLYNSFSEKEKNINNLYSNLNKLEQTESQLETEYDTLNDNTSKLKSELETLKNKIEKNLYEIYSLENEAVKYVDLSKDNYQLYFEYNEKSTQYESINKKYEEKKQELENVRKTINEEKEKIDSSQKELYTSFQSLQELINNIESENLKSSLVQIEQSKITIESARQELKDQNIEEKIEQAKELIKNKKNELNESKFSAETIPLYKNSGFKSLKDDLEKIAIMGRIFPIMFFVIAALVTITTITRMIDEDRKNIGLLKALGYKKSKIMKRYLIYASSAGIIGTILGTLLGSIIIVNILFVSYSSLYDLPELSTRFNFTYILAALGISLFSTLFFAWRVTNSAFKENTAELMRPKMQTSGKHIFLEKIPFFWNNLSFLFKISFRNIFRYKKRLLMALIGIAGCTALIYAGLGLQNAVNSIGNKQFQDIRVVSMEAFLKRDLNQSEAKNIEEEIKHNSSIIETTPIKQQTFTVEANENTKDVFYITISSEQVDKYIKLKNRKNNEVIKLTDEGVVLTEKLANILNVEVGEKIKIVDENISATVQVIGITENYLYNYIYFTPKVYERIYGTEVKYNEIFINTEEISSEKEEIELSNKLKEINEIAGTVWNKNIEKEFKTSLASLMSIVILFIGCASLLSFIVLINLNNINIEERKRELSTIKLLGFYEKELESYVFRENIILTILGTLLGLIIGMGILGIIIQAAEVETIFLVKDINYINLGFSVIVTMGITLITNFMMKRKIKNIDMIDSLKSIE